jgi:hypothetical protein
LNADPSSGIGLGQPSHVGTLLYLLQQRSKDDSKSQRLDPTDKYPGPIIGELQAAGFCAHCRRFWSSSIEHRSPRMWTPLDRSSAASKPYSPLQP